LRSERFTFPRGEEAVRLELELPQNRVLLSDFEDWHHVLNNGYSSYTEAEADAFYQRAKTLSKAQYRREVQASWQRIFEFGKGDPEWRGDPETKAIQATFWEIRLEDVKKVDRFVGARR